MAKRITEQEKEKMWRLHQEGCSIADIVKKTKRCRASISRYIGEYEAALRATVTVMQAQKQVDN